MIDPKLENIINVCSLLDCTMLDERRLVNGLLSGAQLFWLGNLADDDAGIPAKECSPRFESPERLERWCRDYYPQYEQHAAAVANDAEIVSWFWQIKPACPHCRQALNATEVVKALIKVVDSLLLFHEQGAWTAEDQTRWVELTGSSQATTRVLCDAARRALKEAGE
jgi:hypothetical protein